jgi:hypothetical protein
MKKLLVLIILTMYGCAGASAIKAVSRAGCKIQTYHERSSTGEVKIECYENGGEL